MAQSVQRMATGLKGRYTLFTTHLPPIDWGQTRLARPYPGGLFERLRAARIQTLDPETATGYLTALGTHGQPSDNWFHFSAYATSPAVPGQMEDAGEAAGHCDFLTWCAGYLAVWGMRIVTSAAMSIRMKIQPVNQPSFKVLPCPDFETSITTVMLMLTRNMTAENCF